MSFEAIGILDGDEEVEGFVPLEVTLELRIGADEEINGEPEEVGGEGVGDEAGDEYIGTAFGGVDELGAEAVVVGGFVTVTEGDITVRAPARVDVVVLEGKVLEQVTGGC